MLLANHSGSAALDQHDAAREQECTSVGGFTECFTEPGGGPLGAGIETTCACHRMSHVEPDDPSQIAMLAGGYQVGRMGCQDELARGAAHLSEKPSLQGRVKVPRWLVEDRNEAGGFWECGAQQQCFPDPSTCGIDGQVVTVVVNGGRDPQIRRRFLVSGRLCGVKRDVERAASQPLEEVLYGCVLAAFSCVAVLQPKQAYRDVAAVSWRGIGGNILDRVLLAWWLAQIAEQHKATTEDDVKHVCQGETVLLPLRCDARQRGELPGRPSPLGPAVQCHRPGLTRGWQQAGQRERLSRHTPLV